MLNVTSGTERGIYDYQTGTFTISENGLYKLDYKVTLKINNPEGDFKGYGGILYAWMSKNNQFYGARNVIAVLRGIKHGEHIIHDNNVMYLKKGDKLNVRFTTDYTEHINPNQNDILLFRDH